MNTVVRAENLSKSYGKFKALDKVSFSIEKGSIVGLIGPNGAGKTTILNSLLGLNSYEGNLDVLGMSPEVDRAVMMERVCFVSDVGILPGWLKVSEVLNYVEGVHPRFDRIKAEALLADTNIPLKKKVKQLSKGMITQLHLSLVLAIDVELLVLDEPTLGLDILYRKSFYDHLLNDFFDHETSIIITTHQVEEIQSLLSHLLFVNSGKIVLDSAIDDLESQYCELLVAPDQLDNARRLNPIYSKRSLGRTSLFFENIAKSKLESFGEIQVPSVTDLFVAKMQRAGT